jgi:predicted RNA-binding protein with PUA-like domain
MHYWIAKNEPTSYSIDDLKRDKRTVWDGVRNYQVRNMIRDTMAKGDMAFFYHSSAKEIGIAGLMEVASDPYPDPTQFDSKSKYYDSGVTLETPRWYAVKMKFVKKFDPLITLEQIKKEPVCKDIALVKRGNRLSIIEINKRVYTRLLQLREVQ